MNKLTIVISSYLEPEYVDQIRSVDSRLEVVYDPDLVPAPLYQNDHDGRPDWTRTHEQEQMFLGMLARADVSFDFDHVHVRDLASVAPRLKWVQGTSAGIGQLIKEAGLDQTNLTFTTASGVHARPLAEFCLMAMLMFAKGYFRMAADKHARRWERYCSDELSGKTVAIIGLGRIGQEVASDAKKMAMRVVGISRQLREGLQVDKLYSRDQLQNMLREADFLVLSAPHTSETESMIGSKELAAMKPTAVVINVARGALLDEEALINALRNGQIAGAALDVFQHEPPLPHSPLWAMPNVIISPHSASTVAQENGRITEIFCDNLKRFLCGQPLRNVLDKDNLY